ncbi:hypothetical protein [Polymorphum gilvum]|uniref:Uncharacterized protein n=1 Tax=Polymorphum gilvum (strain LMG 25793 / CGMCC 1.9160 / SL003B-26A1) TaxID=991905 RepID=F2J4L8_POLGS|nr:hypothetical protein [Polymorphum gilvum]ADZ72270.1 hypothetical protein SL003B_3850 [Polymorphum gilvum SL003B-26A1]
MTAVAEVGNQASAAPRPVPLPRPKPAGTPAADGTAAASFGFADLVDLVNPLQHIPIVSDIYRAVTGDRIADGPRYAGNALYGMALGGPIGMAAMLAYTAVGQAVESGALPVAPQAGEAPAPATGPLSQAPVAAPGPVERSSLATEDGAGAMPVSDRPLGVTVGAATDLARRAPIDLLAWLDGPARVSAPAGDAAPAGVSARASDTDPLENVVSHPANRLPLEVLETLRQRHQERGAHEPA